MKSPSALLAALSITLIFLSAAAYAAESADPFKTNQLLSLKPALRMGAAVGDPCAETPLKGEMNLPQVVNLALCNNPQTREVWASARVQAAQVGVSQAGYLPGVNVSVSGNRNTLGATQRSLGLNLSYLLYDFGARAANLEYAQQLLAAANATQEGTLQSVFLAAVQAFYKLQAAEAAVRASLDAERAAQQSFAAAQARYLAGSATPADKLQAKTAWSQSSLNRITAEATLHKARGSLANVMGWDANQAVSIAPAQTAAAPVEFSHDIQALIEQAKQQRPDLRAAEAQVKAAQASSEAARAAGKPSIALTASSNQSSSNGINSHGSSLGVSVSVPLFAGYAPTYRVRAAEAQVEVRTAQLERLRSQTSLDVWNAYQDLLSATQALHSTADLLDSASQSQRMTVGRYQAGVGTMLDVLNAQSSLANAQQQGIQAQLNWNISRATLAQAVGKLDAELFSEVQETHTP